MIKNSQNFTILNFDEKPGFSNLQKVSYGKGSVISEKNYWLVSNSDFEKGLETIEKIGNFTVFCMRVETRKICKLTLKKMIDEELKLCERVVTKKYKKEITENIKKHLQESAKPTVKLVHFFVNEKMVVCLTTSRVELQQIAEILEQITGQSTNYLETPEGFDNAVCYLRLIDSKKFKDETFIYRDCLKIVGNTPDNVDYVIKSDTDLTYAYVNTVQEELSNVKTLTVMNDRYTVTLPETNLYKFNALKVTTEIKQAVKENDLEVALMLFNDLVLKVVDDFTTIVKEEMI